MLESKGIRNSVIQEMIGGDTCLARLRSTTVLDLQAVKEKRKNKKVISFVSSVVAAAYI